MTKRVAVIGASIGGLVAAAELKSKGFAVTVIEKGKSVAGLYSKIDTPFGKQEMGMHVLYLEEQHYQHLCAIFGADVFQTWNGYAVDIGASYNFGINSINSCYPDLRDHPEQKEILRQILEMRWSKNDPNNALEAVCARFGRNCGETIFAPILKKLWKQEANLLTPEAIHCLYDLRRIVVCDKEVADTYKQDSWLDQVIANPDQTKPLGQVFSGRRAARFKNSCENLYEKVSNWLDEKGIEVHFGSSVSISNDGLDFNGSPMYEKFDACIVASPLATLIPNYQASMDMLELSVIYFLLEEEIATEVPSYYVLCHDPTMKAVRIVNYGAYAVEENTIPSPVIGVEVTHLTESPPSIKDIQSEVETILPSSRVVDAYKLPNSLKLPSPTLKNANFLDHFTELLSNNDHQKPIFFSGMRTDKGIFFSHHTIGLAYDAAVECTARLS